MTGPEQRSCVGAQRRQENGRCFHITLQTHKTHRDVYRPDVIRVSLKVEESLAEPVVHDGSLGGIIVQLLPDELSHDGLDEETAGQRGQIMSSEQQSHQ